MEGESKSIVKSEIMGEEEKERLLAFLDMVMVPKEDGSLKTRVSRKETHTDQYLNSESHHPLKHKRGVVRTLIHRVDSIVSDPENRVTEKDHIKEVLSLNG